MSDSTPNPDQVKLDEQRLRDEHTVFALAVLMMEVHVGTLLKNKNQVANAFLKSGVVLRGNPGFPERFKDAQKVIIDSLEKLAPSRILLKEAAVNVIRSPKISDLK